MNAQKAINRDLELLAEIKRQYNKHECEVLRLEAEMLRMNLLRQKLVVGDLDWLPKTLSVGNTVKSDAPLVPMNVGGVCRQPVDRNGETTVTDAIRICIGGLPDQFQFSDVQNSVKARFPHVDVDGDSFRMVWNYARKPNVEKVVGTKNFRKRNLAQSTG